MTKLLPCVALEMIPTDAAWFAGFFDGEGTLAMYMNGRTKTVECYRLQIANNYVDALIKCKNITGVGSVLEKTRNKVPAHYQKQYVWAVNSQRNVVEICRQIMPYLVVKRLKVENFYKKWTEAHPSPSGLRPAAHNGFIPGSNPGGCTI